MTILSFIWSILLYIIILIVAAIPLYIALKLLGTRVSILHVIIVNFIAGIIIGLIKMFFGDVWYILLLLVLIVIYKYLFKISWLKAFFAWLIQFIIAYVIIYLMGLFLPGLVGISLFTIF